MCLIQDCQQTHQQHYCGICQTLNSTHFPNNCPKGIDVYHGTKFANISPILNQGFKPSVSGTLGPGIYFGEKPTAISVGRSRNGGAGEAVLKVRINPQKCRNRMVKDNQGVQKIYEWCLDGKNYSVKGVFMNFLKQQILSQNLLTHKLPIYAEGKYKFNGNNQHGMLKQGKDFD